VILVIGGRSKIGVALISDLVARGEQVRALLRSTERASGLPSGVEAVIGDLADEGSIRTAMRGVRSVFLLCGPTQDEVSLNKHAIDSAAAESVELLVRSSILGAEPGSAATFVRDHGVCDEYLRASGVPYTIVRPNVFMQSVLENTVPSIDANGNFYTNAGAARISMVDTRDVAAVAAVVLTTSGQVGQEYDVTGPQALSYQDVASQLTAAMRRRITYVEAGDAAILQALLVLGLGEWMVGALVDLFQDYRRSGTDGYASQVTDTVQKITGRRARSLDQLLSEQPTLANR
jgi:uncharacterized protein YbjT (DUF2867 family)